MMIIIGSCVTVALFLLTHIGITIWWASKMSTLLSVVQDDLNMIIGEFRVSKDKYFTREEAKRELELADKEHRALWKRIDEIKLRGGTT